MWSAFGLTTVILSAVTAVVIYHRYRLWKRIYKEHARVFISYRRATSADLAKMLRIFLESSFRFQSVFLDTSDIDGGEDFPNAIREQIREADTVLVLIDQDWETVEQMGERRIMQENDWVRQEVREALRKPGKVIPVLIGHRKMPDSNDLPEDLKPLLRRAAKPLFTGEHFDATARVLQDLAAKSAKPRGIAMSLTLSDATLLAGILGSFLVIAAWLFNRESNISQTLDTVQNSVDDKLAKQIPLTLGDISSAVNSHGLEKALPADIFGYTLETEAKVKKIDRSSQLAQFEPVAPTPLPIQMTLDTSTTNRAMVRNLEEGTSVKLLCRLVAFEQTANGKIYLSGSLASVFLLPEQ